MKHFTNRTLLAVSLAVALLPTAYGQNTPTADAYTNTGSPSTNYGTATTLNVVSPSETSFITFDLSTVPAGYSGSNVAKASLKLYVNAVTTAGSFNVDYVNGAWSEMTITSSLSPALGTTIAASVPLGKGNIHDYILVDVTPAVVAWLNGTQVNDGLAIVANSPLSASFDSKENTSQSHPPELDIVFTGGGAGTITGVTAGSGLVGGGTKGNVTLSMLNTCASGQILQWNGTAWACANAGSGTITGVTAGTDLTGGGTSGNVTLNLNTAALQTANDARYAQLNAVNAFSQPFSVNTSGGTGIVASALSIGLQGSAAGTGVYGSTTGSGGSPVGVLGASANATGVRGNDSGSGTGVVGTSITGFAVYGTSNGSSGLPANIAAVAGDSNSVPAVWGNSANADGVHGVNASGAAGVSGQNNGGGIGVYGYAAGTSGQGVWGESVATGIAHGIGADGVHGMTHTTNGAGVSGGNDALGGIGVYGYASNSGFGFGTNSNVMQTPGMGGWVKAMAYVDPYAPGGIAVTRCFNSQKSGAAVYTPPCGISLLNHAEGENTLDFGFTMTNSYATVLPVYTIPALNKYSGQNLGGIVPNSGFINLPSTQIGISTFNSANGSAGNLGYVDIAFMIIVF